MAEDRGGWSRGDLHSKFILFMDYPGPLGSRLRLHSLLRLPRPCMTAYVLESRRSFIILTAAPICASGFSKPKGLHWLKGLCSVLSCLHGADLL